MSDRVWVQPGKPCDWCDVMTEEQNDRVYELFDDIQGDATAATNTVEIEQWRKRLQSILQSALELQRLLDE